MGLEQNFEGNEKIINQEIIDKVRDNFVRILEEAIRNYTENGTKKWLNEENCREAIRLIREKVPTPIEGPFYNDLFDGAIEQEGFTIGSPEFIEIQRSIKEGK